MEYSNAARDIQLQIGKLLLIGILLSVAVVITGGIYYLMLHGNESVYLQPFYLQKPQVTSLRALLLEAWHATPLGIIQFGVFILVITQLFRVLLVTWYFAKLRDKVFVLISLFILVVIVTSLFWRF